MTEFKIPPLTGRYVQLFVNVKGKLDVDRLVEVQRLLGLKPVTEPIHLVVREAKPKNPIH
jgi:hypothetical protein